MDRHPQLWLRLALKHFYGLLRKFNTTTDVHLASTKSAKVQFDQARATTHRSSVTARSQFDVEGQQAEVCICPGLESFVGRKHQIS